MFRGLITLWSYMNRKMFKKWHTLYEDLSSFDHFSTEWWTWYVKIDEIYIVFMCHQWHNNSIYDTFCIKSNAPILSQTPRQHVTIPPQHWGTYQRGAYSACPKSWQFISILFFAEITLFIRSQSGSFYTWLNSRSLRTLTITKLSQRKRNRAYSMKRTCTYIIQTAMFVISNASSLKSVADSVTEGKNHHCM